MTNHNLKYSSVIFIITIHFFHILFTGCKQETTDKKEASEKSDSSTQTGTPVTVTIPKIGKLSETVEVHAVSSFLLKTNVKATTSGYLIGVMAKMGGFVEKGQPLFTIKTKESQTLGNRLRELDSTLHFEGTITIKSPAMGYVSNLNYREGDYVLDGEQIITITDTKSLVFILDLPYELKPYLHLNQHPTLHFPDGTHIQATISHALPTVDAVSQTQSYLLKVESPEKFPENLIANINWVKATKERATTLPKNAILTDETQNNFWIMVMKDSSTAVKIPITKGIENGDTVEILTPPLSIKTKVLTSGNYGLGDTAKVMVSNSPYAGRY